MNKLIPQIKEAQKQYRIASIKENNGKAKIKAVVLSTLLGEIENKQKLKSGFNKEDVYSIIKKFVNNITETLKMGPNETLTVEIEALKVFLPKQMTEHELRKAIIEITRNMPKPLTNSQFGPIMAELKRNHGGQFDNGAASKIIKSML